MMKKHLVFICLLALPFLWMSFATPPPARGATIIVDTDIDVPLGGTDGLCSLREAMQNANDDAATEVDCDPGSGADIITFDASVLTIVLTENTSISLISEIDIQGPIIIDGNNATTIFVIAGSGDVTLNQVELQNGRNNAGGAIIVQDPSATLTINQGNIHDNVANGNGGAINSDGVLNINNTIFTDNTADGDGGAIYQTSGFMTIDGSAFTGNIAGNVAGGNGGAIYHGGAVSEPSSITGSYFSDNRALNADNFDGGGAIYHGSGILNIFASAFSGNNADGDYALGGAIFNNSSDVLAMAIEYSHFGQTLSLTIPQLFTISITDPNTVTGTTNPNAGGGAIFNNGSLVLLSSSIIGNTSSNHGGGFHNIASTIDPPTLGQQVIVANSTFANNNATVNGGAIYHANEDDLLQLVNLTIANNTAASGGGIFNFGDGESPDVSINDDVSIVNTILANNTPNNCAGGSIGNGNLIPSGNNVVFGGACDIRQQDGSSTAASPITADPQLGTEELTFSIPSIITIAFPLGTNSSANGTGDATLCANFPVINLDQRAFPRPAGAPACDIGAYESSNPAPEPEINVQGNSVTIADGETTISNTDHTLFPPTTVGTAVSRTYTIQNTGTGTLTITLPVTVPAGFTVTADPATSVAPTNGSTTFTVQCTAATAATFTGTVIIGNNDSNENPYNFDISCTVAPLEPEITVLGNSVIITNGDNTPDTTDHTIFVATTVGSPVTRNFTIRNESTATANLNLTGISPDFVTIGGANPTEFSISAQPGITSIAPGIATGFVAQCDGDTVGTWTATVSIANDDLDENPYTFDISCTVNPTAPQIEVFGAVSQPIDDGGGNSPALVNTTDFGTVTVGSIQQRTYTIVNNGTAPLDITTVNLIGSGFSIVTDPTGVSVVAGGGTTDLVIACDTSVPFGYIGGVTIVNNSAPTTDQYTFNLACSVSALEPEMDMIGIGMNPINDGDGVASALNGTAFGTTTVGLPIPVTYTIENNGTADLTIGAITLPSGFSVVTPPAGTVPAGGDTTIDLQCDALTDNVFTGSISIVNNDSDENPYNFAVSCTVNPAPTFPEINLVGNSANIVDGQTVTSTTDHTLFVATTVGNPVSRTFTIQNTGAATLDVFSTTVSTGAFGVTTPLPPYSILAGGDTPLTVECLATGAGDFTAFVEVTSNDSDENPYTFDIRCVVTAIPEPEMDMFGNGMNPINDGAGTPVALNGTAFGTTTVGTAITRTFRIENNGSADLTIGAVTVPAGFSVPVAPAPLLTAGAAVTFDVVCDALTDNVFTGSISIVNNDSDENPYNFAVSCTVNPVATAPEINVVGNTVTIPNGDLTPSGVDHTDFGSTPVGTPVVRVFTIENTGSGNLNLASIVLPVGFNAVPPIAPAFVPNGGSIDFGVECPASGVGVVSGTVIINNDDSDENPYTFAITCNVTAVAQPEINLVGNTVTIPNGDLTPSGVDHTDFGSTPVGTPVVRTFTIENTGSAVLNISSVSIPVGFNAVAPFASPTVAATNGTSDFGVECPASSVGVISGTISILSDDSDESPYTFAITCNVTSVDPEINVQGNGIDITDGDTTPDTADDTDFGTTPVNVNSSRTFTIQNLGVNNLTVSITTPAAPFSITLAPTSPIMGGGSTTFTVECDATIVGGFSTTIEIINNDSDENPFTFEVACLVSNNAPEINILGNGVTINDGDNTPSITDHTDFGTTNVGIPLSRTFTIQNLGVLNLTVTNPITVPAGFTVLVPPTSPVAPAGNTTFTIVCDATVASTYGGTVVIANNDANENPYEFDITCVVNLAATSADLSLTKTVSDSTPQVGDTLTYTLTLSNAGPDATTNVEVVDILPPTVTYQVGSFNASQGTFDEGTLTWTVGTMGSPSTAILTFDVVVNTSTGITINYAQVTASDTPDINSQPNNGTPPTVNQDDEAIIEFLFDPPFGRKAFTEAGVNVLEWTIVWANPGNNPVVVEMSDPLLGGTTFVAGSLSCTSPGTTTITTCLHDPIANEIVFTGIIDPNPGSTPATLDSATNRLIIVYRVLVPDGVTSVSNTATLTQPGNPPIVVQITETYTRTIVPPPTTGGTPPLTTEQIQATVTALPATGETPWWADVARGALVVMTLIVIVGVGGYWRKRMTQRG